ncbi:MAG: hypothetical protein ACE5KJ_00935 [Candidatus Zixiibacteriota bacterium]
MKKASFILVISLLVLFYVPSLAEDSGYGHIVGDRKYFGRNYIVKNPRATLPPPDSISLAKMDSTLQECEVWSEDYRASNWIYPPAQPRVGVVGDTIHVVWKQRFYSKFTHHEVCYVRSTDGGISWSDSILLSVTDGVESICPDVAVQGNNVYVVWEDWTSMDWGGIYFRKSTDGGTTWQDIIPIALRGVDDYDYYRPTMVVKDSSVFVAFGKIIDQDGMLKFKKSTDCGETWSEEIHVSDLAMEGRWPKMVLNSAGLYIANESGLRIWCNKTTDWGDTWSDDIFISDMDSSIAQWPSIGADDNGGVYITWFDYKYSPYPWTGDIFLRRSTDNGVSWDSIMVLTDSHLCDESDVCADESSVWTVWRDERYGDPDFEIYGRRSNDQGASWEPEQNLSNAPYQSYNPRVITYSDWMHMVWVDARDLHGDTFYKRGTWYFRGDSNHDKIINVADVIYLVNYLFMAGPPPVVFECGDVNDDNQVNVADVVYLINYLFAGGPPPAEC